ncbi:Krr1-domain-containing protein [Suhomyces tanzawaensis NRRL Y-17324]|uniref:Krr1-domain-containing protein n=1 Tax=Suhomyces tanzawaensis NRRL Y-17324 TaxID=984487 RepID=A0A1E4SC01_9ASCO|nr:Krr1-domain-containing protein [Suhomyces tanzawaensis NRRL Y-17324]ODV77047.1 Krr1-domain-containing protein [Suhomyces tanzawaensis NRRL Y-17324]
MARKKSAAKKAREEAEAKGIKAPATAAPTETKVEEVEKPAKKTESTQSTQYEEDSDSESSSSEEEDEFGDLITEDVEKGIEQVLQAIKTDPKKLLDPNTKFFDDPENVTANEKKEKPLYLKDYHRMNLLSGNYKDDDDEEFNTVDGEKPFVVTQREERNQLLSDIKNAFDEEEEDDDDDFLKKVEPKEKSRNEELKSIRLPNPNEDGNEFLKAFLDNQAWIPSKNDKVLNLDRIDQDDEEQFDDAVEKFEHAYNFRYEDANAAEIVSYARSQATLRRSATNARKRQREKEQEEKQKENKKSEELVKKKKTQKLNKVIDRLAQIKEAVGDEVSDEVIQKVFGDSLLNDDFDDGDWDSKMAQIFDEQYYGAEDVKPEFDDDLGDIVSDADEDADEGDEENEHNDEEDVGEDIGEDVGSDEPPKKKSKKEQLKEKKSSKKDKEALKARAQQIVEANALKIRDEVDEERGRSRASEDIKFKYREVSPETFGLTTRDIILADDKQLNTFIGIKKFAPYRAKEARLKDKRKYTKKKHLQEWRKEAFGDKHGPKLPDGAKENEIWIPAEEEEVNSRREKREKKHKHKSKRK